MLVMTWRKRNPPPVSVGLHFGTVTTKTVFSFLKKLQIEQEYDAVIPFLGTYQKETKNTNSKRYMHPKVRSSIIAKVWKQPRYPSTGE